MSSLTQLAKEKTATARADFIAAVWRGEPAVRLLACASSTGLPLEEADRLITKIEALKPLKAAVANLATLRSEMEKASKAFAKTKAAKRAVIDKAENEIAEAAIVVADARKRLNAVEMARRELLEAECDGLAPRSFLTEEMEDQAAKDMAAQKRLLQHREAAEYVRHCEQVLQSRTGVLDRMERERCQASMAGTFQKFAMTLIRRGPRSIRLEKI